MTEQITRPKVQIDIVSDVVCPWCIVGFKQLDQALSDIGAQANLLWHPFELNPNMPAEGQNLGEHIREKYGSSPEQSQQARAQLTQLGSDLGFAFNFSDDSRIVNTFQAHQLLDWAALQGRQHVLKLALFSAYFTQEQDVSDSDVLIRCAVSAGLDGDAAQQVLSSGSHAASVREKQQFWTERGISGVPSMVFEGKFLITGAQGVETYTQVLQRVLEESV
ncbi:DsbA family oxidoreductase [Phaeobacter sp. NW0010-22]|uniref:DsbA family oxidoreductase n=1 Tax=Phaeobacter sp. NW0010-22 TaxID=3135907 RepID=UPI00310A486A